MRQLLRMGVDLRLFLSESGINYHPKMWIFEGACKLASFTGSSNLSMPALSTNIEANILLVNDHAIVKEQINYFECLWEKFSFKEVDEEWIDHYVDMERALSIGVKYGHNGLVDYKESSRQVSDFISGWQRHIPKGSKRGQYERWRGWYIIPEPAKMDESRMLEFKNLLLAIARSREYRRNGFTNLTIPYVNEILADAKITYKGHGQMTRSPKGRRDLFIRQHKDCLARLGFIEAVDKEGPKIAITDLGRILEKSTSSEERRAIYTESLHKVSWPWAPKLKLYAFLVKLMKSMPKKRLYYHELSFLVIHAEHNRMFGPVRDLVLMFRALPRPMKRRLVSKFEEKLENELTRRNKWGYYRYQRKIRELIALFGYASDISCHYNSRDEDSYIEVKG